LPQSSDERLHDHLVPLFAVRRFGERAVEGEMDSPPVLFEVGSELGESYISAMELAGENEQAFYSTVHGAGRVMSRSQAAGRVRRQTVYACSVRDCEFSVPAKGYSGQTCPEHPTAKMRKWKTEQVVRPGVVDWRAVQARLREQGIVLVGGGADEAPEGTSACRRSLPRTATRSG
jgi:tRNA-splicing ligase RtcB